MKSEPPSAVLRRADSRLIRRARAARTVAWAGRGVAFTGVALSLVVLPRWVALPPSGLSIVIAAIVGLAILGLLAPQNRQEIVRAADAALGLDELWVTASESRDEKGPWSKLVLSDAARRIDSVDLRRAIRLWPSSGGLKLVTAGLVGWLLVSVSVLGPWRSQCDDRARAIAVESRQPAEAAVRLTEEAARALRSTGSEGLARPAGELEGLASRIAIAKVGVEEAAPELRRILGHVASVIAVNGVEPRGRTRLSDGQRESALRALGLLREAVGMLAVAGIVGGANRTPTPDAALVGAETGAGGGERGGAGLAEPEKELPARWHEDGAPEGARATLIIPGDQAPGRSPQLSSRAEGSSESGRPTGRAASERLEQDVLLPGPGSFSSQERVVVRDYFETIQERPRGSPIRRGQGR